MRGEGEAERNKVFAARIPARSGVLLLLPLDAGLCEEHDRLRHDIGAQPEIGILQIFWRRQDGKSGTPARPADCSQKLTESLTQQ